MAFFGYKITECIETMYLYSVSIETAQKSVVGENSCVKTVVQKYPFEIDK